MITTADSVAYPSTADAAPLHQLAANLRTVSAGMESTASIPTIDIRIPAGWVEIGPPEGVRLVVCPPPPTGPLQVPFVHPNLVVTAVAELVGRWTTPPAAGAPATQRLVVRYRLDDVDVDVDVVQQQIGMADTVIVATATLPAGLDDDMAETIGASLDSIGSPRTTQEQTAFNS